MMLRPQRSLLLFVLLFVSKLHLFCFLFQINPLQKGSKMFTLSMARKLYCRTIHSPHLQHIFNWTQHSTPVFLSYAKRKLSIFLSRQPPKILCNSSIPEYSLRVMKEHLSFCITKFRFVVRLRFSFYEVCVYVLFLREMVRNYHQIFVVVVFRVMFCVYVLFCVCYATPLAWKAL